MEESERELIVQYSASNFELRKLYKQHKAFEKKLTVYSSRTYLTDPEREEINRIKLRKLRGVERMIKIVRGGDQVHR